MKDYELYRKFIKSDFLMEVENIDTDQDKKIPQPDIQKACVEDSLVIDLVSPENFTSGNMSIIDILKSRKSRRVFSNNPLSFEELSFLLWSIQGVKKIVKNGYATLRTVPSAGARHPFETYVAIYNVEGIKQGLYRYLPLDHKLNFIKTIDDNIKDKLVDACLNQKFVVNGAVTFIWTVIPYRSEWRYDIGAHKVIAMDAGHMCENLYLAAEAINAGTCAVGAYDQKKLDDILGVDGKNEFSIYIAPVGKQIEK